MWENLGVAERTIIDKQRERLAPFTVVRAHDEPAGTVAVGEDGVLLAGEVIEHLIVGEAAAVKAHVEHDAVLVEVVGIEGADESLQARLVHARYVDVTELAARELADSVGVAA